MDKTESEKRTEDFSPEKDYHSRFWIFLALIFLALIFWSSIGLQQKISDSADMIRAFIRTDPSLGILAFIALAAASALISFFSSVILVPIAVMFWGEFQTAIYLLLGWILGGAAAYLIGSSAGYTILKKIYSVERIDYYKNKIPRKSQFWLILLFRLAVPAEITGYTLGIIRYHFGKFLLATLLAEIPFAFIAAYSGGALVQKNPPLFFLLIALGAILLGAMAYLFKHRLKG